MHPIVTMKFSVSAVVQVAVSCKNAQDLPKLVEGLKRLSKSDPLVKCSHAKTGEHIIASTPRMLEPYYIVDIMVPTSAVSGVYSTLNARRGEVHSMEERPGTPLTQIKGYLPVLSSFGFVALLRKNTSGQAFPQMKFSHWAPMSGNPMDEEDTKETNAHQIIMEIRKRKGMKLALPKFSDFYDRI